MPCRGCRGRGFVCGDRASAVTVCCGRRGEVTGLHRGRRRRHFLCQLQERTCRAIGDSGTSRKKHQVNLTLRLRFNNGWTIPYPVPYTGIFVTPTQVEFHFT